MRTLADITEEDLASSKWTHEDLLFLANNKLNLEWSGDSTKAPQDPLLPELDVIARKVEMMDPKALLAFSLHCNFEEEYLIPKVVFYRNVNQATLEEHAGTMSDMLFSIRKISDLIKTEMQESKEEDDINGYFGRIYWEKSKGKTNGRLEIYWRYNFEKNEPEHSRE